MTLLIHYRRYYCTLITVKLFTLVDSEGNNITEEEQLGLLLYKGGTVCDDSFDAKAAEAICKQMNFTRAVEWNSDTNFGIQSDYDIKLDEVECLSADWRNCTYSEDHDCGHSEDVFLRCSTFSFFFSFFFGFFRFFRFFHFGQF